MTLRIGTLDTRCRFARGQEATAALIDETARVLLPRELTERLGPSLDRQSALVRLRRLDVKLRLDPATLRAGGLAEVWAIAMVRALHQALARPDGDGATLRRFPTRAAYLAAMVAHAAGHPSEPARWPFPELRASADRPPAVTTLALLLDAGPLLADILHDLRQNDQLATVLAPLDETGLERLIRAVAEAEGGTGALTADQVATVAATLLALGQPPAAAAAAGRRAAIALWLRLNRALPLRGIWQATRLLLALLQQPALLAPGLGTAALPPTLAAAMTALPPWCETVRRDLAAPRPARAAGLLEDLARITPSAVRRRGPAEALWLQSDCAGVLLLCASVRRLGWPRLLHDPGVGPRTFQALLAGTGMRLLGPWRPGDPVETAVAALAGIFAGTDLPGIAQALHTAPLASLGPFIRAADWPTALDAAADALAHAFATTVRGFRRAGRDSVVRHFLRIPGRILVEDHELRVVLGPSSWSVALHISGADDPIEDVPWLGGRRVTILLEGL
jgi:hypothetical protein